MPLPFSNDGEPMPVTVRKGKGAKPYKIVEVATGRVVGASTTAKKAHISAGYRNKAYMLKRRGGAH